MNSRTDLVELSYQYNNHISQLCLFQSWNRSGPAEMAEPAGFNRFKEFF